MFWIDADRHAEPLEDRPVPLGVALGEVVVDRDEVDAGARERVQVERGAGDERLALTGLHLGDVALVQDDPAHHLDVEHPLLRLAPARLAHGGEGLEEEFVERLAVLQPLPQRGSRAAQLLVGELLEVRLERGDVVRLLRPAASRAGPRRRAGPSRALRGLQSAMRLQGSRSRCFFTLRFTRANSTSLASRAMRGSSLSRSCSRLIPAAGAATARDRQARRPRRRPCRVAGPRSRMPTSTRTAATRSGCGTSRRAATVAWPATCFVSTSTGSGVAGGSPSQARALWLTYTGGNIRDWSLWTKRRPGEGEAARVSAGRRRRAGADHPRARLGGLAAVRDRARPSSFSLRTASRRFSCTAPDRVVELSAYSRG